MEIFKEKKLRFDQKTWYKKRREKNRSRKKNVEKRPHTLSVQFYYMQSVKASSTAWKIKSWNIGLICEILSVFFFFWMYKVTSNSKHKAELMCWVHIETRSDQKKKKEKKSASHEKQQLNKQLFQTSLWCAAAANHNVFLSLLLRKCFPFKY